MPQKNPDLAVLDAASGAAILARVSDFVKLPT
jgi:hypothetical protein